MTPPATQERPGDQVEPRRRSRPIRLLIVVLVVVLVLVGLLIVADRGVQRLAENQIAARLQTRTRRCPTKPTVDLGPFPFLTEIATGTARLGAGEDRRGGVAGQPRSHGHRRRRHLHASHVSDRFSRIVAGQRSRRPGCCPTEPERPDRTGLSIRRARTGCRSASRCRDRALDGCAARPPAGRCSTWRIRAWRSPTPRCRSPRRGVPQAVVDAAGQFALRRVPLAEPPVRAPADLDRRSGRTGSRSRRRVRICRCGADGQSEGVPSEMCSRTCLSRTEASSVPISRRRRRRAQPAAVRNRRSSSSWVGTQDRTRREAVGTERVGARVEQPRTVPATAGDRVDGQLLDGAVGRGSASGSVDGTRWRRSRRPECRPARREPGSAPPAVR